LSGKIYGLRNSGTKQNQGMLDSEAKYDSIISNFPLGAGNGIRVGLQNLFNDQNVEGKLLAFQLELLRNHLENNFKSS